MTATKRLVDSGSWHAVRSETAGMTRTAVLHELRRGGFDVSGEIVETAEAFRQRVKERTPDLVLADYNLGHWRGMEALEILHFEGLDIPLILLSDTLGEVTAVECIK